MMVAVGVNSFMVLLIPVFATVAASLEGRKRIEDVSISQLVNPKTREIDGNLAQHLWINCRLDLIHMKEDINLCLLDEIPSSTDEIDSKKSRSLSKENVQKSGMVVQPQLKEILMDCLKLNNLLVPVSGEEIGCKNWCIKYLGSLCSRSDVRGQHPSRALLQRTDTPAPAPAHKAGAPNFSPGPSPDTSPSSSQIPDSEFSAPSPQDPLYSPFYSDSDSPPADDTVSESPDSGSNVQDDEKNSVQDDEQNSRNRTVVVAVIVTASVTLLVAALLFLCCTRVCRTGPLSRKNDERPLLSLSLNDYSVGSSHKSFVLGGSIKEEKGGHQAFRNNLSNKKMASSLDNKIHIESDVLNTSLSRTGSHGLPPLKPPPGQVEPLPPERPASLKPPPGKPGPPPPPAPRPSVTISSGNAAPPPGPPPPPPPRPGTKPDPRPPPPPKSGAPPKPPQPMPLGSKVPRPSPIGLKHSSDAASSGEGEDDAPKTKLKPFFWDKVLASPDTSMVWHQIKSGSFQFNEEMIENLFGYASVDKNKNDRRKGSSSQDPTTQYIQIIDSKKAQNLSILLRALNVTAEEICGAIHEGNELPSELLQTLLKMAPTAEEELKLRLFSGELSQLGPADRFLKALVDIPFAFKRLEALLFMSILQEEVSITKESFATLEVACKELRNSRLFLKLLEAVLKTGNRMNDGTFRGGAQAFKLDTLLKLSDVKGIDGKITLLHFVVQEIIRSEGIRAGRVARESGSVSSMKTDDLFDDMPNFESEEHYRSLGLQVVSGLGNELEHVKKAANLDSESVTRTVAKLGHALVKTRDFLKSDMENSEEKRGFYETLKSFVKHAELDIMWLLEEEKRIMTLVKSTGDYFHGNAAKDEGLRLFIIVRDFLIILDKVCKEVRESTKKSTRTQRKETPAPPSSSEPRQPPSPDIRSRLFPAITDCRTDDSSSDDES